MAFDLAPGILPVQPPQSVFREDGLLRLVRNGMPLPADRCFKCNAPASVTKRKTIAWHHPAVYFTILANILVYLIVAACVQKRAVVEFGLCEKCRNRRILKATIWTCVSLSSIPLFTLALFRDSGLAAAAGGLALVAGLFGLLLALRIGWPKRIDEVHILLAGSGKAYRDMFPEQ